MELDAEDKGAFRKIFRKIALPLYLVILIAVIVGLILRSTAIYYPALAALVILIILEMALGPSTRVLEEGDILYRIRSTYRRLWDEHLFIMAFSYMQLTIVFIILYERYRFDIYLIITILACEASFFVAYYATKQWKKNRLGDMDIDFEDDDEISSEVENFHSAGPIITAIRKEKYRKSMEG